MEKYDKVNPETNTNDLHNWKGFFMGAWEPTIGKWYDEDNYVIKEPLWKEMLNFAAKHSNVKDIQQVIIWLNNKNLSGDDIKIYVIGYALSNAGIDLKKEYPGLDYMTSKIIHYSQISNNLTEYVALVMKDFHVSDEIIAEFETSR